MNDRHTTAPALPHWWCAALLTAVLLTTYVPKVTATPPSTVVGGTLPEDTTFWTTNMGEVLVTSSVLVPTGGSLTIEQGTVVSLSAGVMIRAQTGAFIDILGTDTHPVTLRRAGGGDWDELTATGTNASLRIQHADISGGSVRVLAGATGLIEDAHIHHWSPTGSAIVYSDRSPMFTLRRCHIEFYHETLFQRSLMLIEECLFENAINPSSDALDFDGALDGSVIRQTTFRNGLLNNTDAVDLGPGGNPTGVVVEDCVMHDFSDKGVSIGEIGANPLELIIRNCLIYNTGSGVQVKDTTAAIIHDCTIVDSDIGIHGFEKSATRPGGGIITNYNNILYNNLQAIAVEPPPNPTIIEVEYSDTLGMIWPGTGNINVDPLFVDPSERDYRLTSNSPCLGTGRDGTDMGVQYPIGGVPAIPENLQITGEVTNAVALSWDDTSIREDGFRIEISTNGVLWGAYASAPANATMISMPGLPVGFYYQFRVRSTNWIAASPPSNRVGGGGLPGDMDGDGMPDDYETEQGFNPNDPADALADRDNDGMTNLDEFLACTDPADPGSLLKFESITLPAGDLSQVRLQFYGVEGKVYTIEYQDNNIQPGNWQTLLSTPPLFFTSLFTITDAPPPGVGIRFYRVRLSTD